MKILIIRLSSIGDIVLTQPVVKSLRDQFPQAQIDYVTKKKFAPLVSKFADVDHIIEADKSVSFYQYFWKKKYDLAFDLHAKLPSFLIRISCFHAKRFTYSKQHFLRWKIVKKLTSKQIFSTLNLYFSALKKAEVKFDTYYPTLNVSSNIKKKYWLFFPGATHYTKRLPVLKWIELINLLTNDYTSTVVLHGSNSEKDICAKIFDQINTTDKKNLCGTQSIAELIECIAESSLVFSNDSGPMHIAAALKKPQIAFFGSTTTELGFRPMNTKALVFQNMLPCQPCTLHGEKKCPLTHFKCMYSFDMKEVKIEIENQFIL